MSEDGKPVPGSTYFYAPNQAAPVFFAIAFAVSGFRHLWQCYRYKCFEITLLYPICCLLFTVGFAVREYSAFDYDNSSVYAISTLFIYASPPLLELGNCLILGRVLYYVPYLSPLHPGNVVTTFGMLSGLIEALNARGVSLSTARTPSEKDTNLGHTFMKASLSIQLLVFSLFGVLAGMFIQRFSQSGIRTERVWGPMLTLYISMTLIIIRTIYRTIEIFDIADIRLGDDGRIDPTSLSPAIRYEWYFYVFEASLMLVNSFLWNVRHPRHYLPERYSTYLAQDGVTELEAPRGRDDRGWWLRIIDPLGFCRGEREEQKPFWEMNGYSYLRDNEERSHSPS